MDSEDEEAIYLKPRKKVAKDGTVSWLARWYDPQASNPVRKVVRSKSFRTKRDAEAYQARMVLRIRQGTYVDPTLGKVTLAQWWERFLETSSVNLKPSTRETYSARMKVHVLGPLGRRPLATLTRLDIETWIGNLTREGVKPANIKAAHSVLRRVLQSAKDVGVIGTNPATGVATPRVPREEMRILSPAEVEAIANEVAPRYRALVLLLAYGGLRIGEATALRVASMDLLRGRVNVAEAFSEVGGRLVLGSTKTAGSRRVVTLPSSITHALREHLDRFPPGPDGLVFTGAKGGAVRRTAFYHRVWIPALRRANIQGHVRVHDLRHTAVSLAIMVGAHPKEIQARAGHSSITVTMDRYGHLFPGQDEALAARLDALIVAPTDDGWSTVGLGESGKVVGLYDKRP